MILVAGAGLAGLSAAYHLEEAGCEHLLVEKEPQVGGLCRSITQDGYTFDYSGHLLCFQAPEIRSWVLALMGNRLASFERKASVFLKGGYVPYPFQAHLGALPEAVMRECLGGMILEAVRSRNLWGLEDLGSWVVAAFGKGMARHFFVPYNRKLWGMDLRDLSPVGLEWSIPRPSLTQVVDGALGGRSPELGYNPQFHYPLDGGIEELPKALYRKLSCIRTSCGIRQVRWKERLAVLEDGQRVAYVALISTIPLPYLMALLEPVPDGWIGRPAQLRWVPVRVLNVGVRREGISDQHWIYFPEEDYPFFRVGCYTAFGSHLAPRGCSSLYVEVSGHTVARLDEQGWVAACLEGLRACGILKSTDQVDVVLPLLLPVAYVIHDHVRLELLPEIMPFLKEEGIHSIGRYGGWGYGTMEQALAQGKAAAHGLMGHTASPMD